MRANDVRRGSRVLCPRGGFLYNIFVCFSLFLWFAVAMVLFPLHLSFLFFYFCLSFIFSPTVFALPSPCSLHFLPPNFHHLIPVTGSSAEQCCALWPRLFFWQGDVRVASFDVTSGPTSQQLSAPRLALSGAFFHCLSLIPFPLYPPLITFFFSIFRFHCILLWYGHFT